MTGAIKLALAAAGVGLVGGVVTERLLTPESIEKSQAGDQWGALHEDFLEDHPTPDGTRVLAGSEPPWKNAALVGGAAVGVGLLGGGILFGATRLKPQSYPLGVAGLAVAALGVGALAGSGASYAVR